jgi:hypothetical protein
MRAKMTSSNIFGRAALCAAAFLMIFHSESDARAHDQKVIFGVLMQYSRFSEKYQYCNTQHIIEHVVARELDRRLLKYDRLLFSIDASSSLDSIAILIEIIGGEIDPNLLRDDLESIMSGNIDDLTIGHEKILVNYEELIRSAEPGSDDIIIDSIFSSLPQSKSVICDYKEALRSIDWRLYISGPKDGGHLMTGHRELNPDSIAFSPRETGGSDSAPEVLVIWLPGELSADRHMEAFAEIFNAANGNNLQSLTVQALGIGGMIVRGPPDDLSILSKYLKSKKSAFENNQSFMMHFARVRAFGRVCRSISNNKHNGRDLSISTLLNPYFLFEIESEECRDHNYVLSKNRTLAFDGEVFAISGNFGSEKQMQPVERGDIYVDICVKEGEVNEGTIDAIIRSIRDYLRFDMGSALNIVRFEPLHGDCVGAVIYTPNENKSDVFDHLRSITDGNSDFLRRRCVSAAIHGFSSVNEKFDCGTPLKFFLRIKNR